MNPVVTLTFYRLKKVIGWDAIFYVMSQFAGGVAGTAVAFLLLRMALAHHEVNFAVTQPGQRGALVAFLAELLISFLMMSAVLRFSNHPRLARYTGLAAGVLVMLFITFEAPLSGMSMNPAELRNRGGQHGMVRAVDLLHRAAAGDDGGSGVIRQN